MTNQRSRRFFLVQSTLGATGATSLLGLGSSALWGLLLPGCRTPGSDATLQAADVNPTILPKDQGLGHVRRSVTDTGNKSMVDLYAKAVAAMKATAFPQQVANENGVMEDVDWWEAQARLHLNNCPHGNWFFLPWHRAYLYYFESVCRKFAGDDSFTLPYWDWSKDPQVPASFWGDASNPLFDASRGCSKDDSAPANAVAPNVVGKIMAITDFLAFGSGRADATRPKKGGATGQLEGVPHNQIHVFVGGDSGDMGTFLSPRDPIFWLHHCNIDRLWATWQQSMLRQKHSPLPTQPPLTGPEKALTAKFWLSYNLSGYYQTDDGKAVAPATMLVSATQDISSLQYGYDAMQTASIALTDGSSGDKGVTDPQAMDGAQLRTGTLAVSARVAPTASSAAKVLQGEPTNGDFSGSGGFPILFTVSRTEALQTLLKQCQTSWATPGAGMNLRLLATNIPRPAHPQATSLEFYLNGTGNLTPSADSFIGAYAYFGHDHGAHGAHKAITAVFDLRQALTALKASADQSTIMTSTEPFTVTVLVRCPEDSTDSTDFQKITLSIEFDA